MAVIEPDGSEKKLSSGWSSVQGILWSPAGDEIWFTASDSGSAANLRGVTLAGKVRTIINVPGGMWLQDARGGMTLMTTQPGPSRNSRLAAGRKRGSRTGLVRVVPAARYKP